jgi:hypothetical protein
MRPGFANRRAVARYPPASGQAASLESARRRRSPSLVPHSRARRLAQRRPDRRLPLAGSKAEQQRHHCRRDRGGQPRRGRNCCAPAGHESGGEDLQPASPASPKCQAQQQDRRQQANPTTTGIAATDLRQQGMPVRRSTCRVGASATAAVVIPRVTATNAFQQDQQRQRNPSSAADSCAAATRSPSENQARYMPVVKVCTAK